MRKPAVIVGVKHWSFGFPYVIASDFLTGFRARGIAAFHAPIAGRGTFYEDLSQSHRVLFTVLMNFTHESARLTWQGKVLTWQQDNPYVMMDRVRSAYPDQHWLCADRDGVENAAFYFGARHPAMHLPHWATRFDGDAGPMPDSRRDWERQRPFDLLFVGSIREQEIDETRRRIDAAPPPVRVFARRLLERIHSHPRDTVTQSAFALEAELGLDLSRSNFTAFRQILGQVDFLVRAINRVELFKRLKGLRITVVSNDVSTIERYAGPVQTISPSDFVTGLVAMKQAKLMINNLPIYRYGATERLFNAQYRGAAVLSERNAYLEETFGDGAGIFLYDPERPDGIGDRIAAILADRDTLFAVAREGHRRTHAHHTIDNRVDAILQAHGTE
ncbi:glycosyltransferase [Azospirillum halopraeferens]|uniref:glycosyltransferase n=1 Tax=Azospirillum halopraeferens TaxID=34010 RepID=UPI0003F9E9D8|nr:glycosyltransferase [Azospirillum halopraeferens]